MKFLNFLAILWIITSLIKVKTGILWHGAGIRSTECLLVTSWDQHTICSQKMLVMSLDNIYVIIRLYTRFQLHVYRLYMFFLLFAIYCNGQNSHWPCQSFYNLAIIWVSDNVSKWLILPLWWQFVDCQCIQGMPHDIRVAPVRISFELMR